MHQYLFIRSAFLAIAISIFASIVMLGYASPLPPDDNRYYEMRVYYAAPGKLEDLQARFRNHTTRIFEKHGMTNVGYWVPIDNPDNKLIYILSYPDKEARAKAWKDFGSDPEWQKVAKESEANGKLVAKVESTFMKRTDYSPKIAPSKAKDARIFELRTYTTPPGKLTNLHARFHDHTMKLFKKHDMTNIGYWEVIKENGSESNVLTYILAHKSKEAGESSFKAFREDPNWIKAKTASEVNGSLTEKVESVYMTPTDFSTIK